MHPITISLAKSHVGGYVTTIWLQVELVSNGTAQEADIVTRRRCFLAQVVDCSTIIVRWINSHYTDALTYLQLAGPASVLPRTARLLMHTKCISVARG